jgi:hypothetical protein
VQSTLRLFGNEDEETLRRRFAEFVCGGGDGDSISDRIRSAERIVGTQAFKTSIAAASSKDGGGAITPLTAQALVQTGLQQAPELA